MFSMTFLKVVNQQWLGSYLGAKHLRHTWENIGSSRASKQNVELISCGHKLKNLKINLLKIM